MDSVFKRTRRHYVLGGCWVEVGKGKDKRRELQGGKRVPNGTPGGEVCESPSRDWYARINGRYVKLSPDRAVAEKMLRKKLTELEDFKVNRFAKHEQTPFANHVVDFREHLEARGRDARYIKEAIGRLKIVAAGCTKLEHLTAAKVNKCLNELGRICRSDQRKIAELHAKGKHEAAAEWRKKSKGAGPATLNNYLNAAKGFCEWCVDERRLPDNPLDHLKKLNERVDIRRERRALSEEEIGRLIAGAELSTEIVRELPGSDRAMLYAFAVGTGLRASEIASLTNESLKLDDAPPIAIVEAAHSKRRKREEQPMPTWLAGRLRAWLEAKERRRRRKMLADSLREWRSKRPGDLSELLRWRSKRPNLESITLEATPLWPGSWRRHAAEVLRVDLAAAGIDYRDSAGRTFDFHALRHQYISDLCAAGVHLAVAQDLARHSTPVLTKRYTHVALHDQIGAVQSLREPRSTLALERQRATGTDDARANVQLGPGDVEQKWSKRTVTGAENLPQSASHGQRGRVATFGEKPLAVNELRKKVEAEGKGFEPSTPCGAPHFQNGAAVKKGLELQSGSKCGADVDQTDPGLAALIDAWPKLSDEQRRYIRAIVAG